ncbi:uncharacterized protein CC84DRAFT_1171077 [Paraphaeosphaeria sporulosa]|uniref:Uncharacterized protein n=1 Tax=Paraphaeosphaeria sporulosa TaxID=1460663 RepID=A0A177CZQ5_9PLEO|nr:uncharacterized protein CC84DRAFT_1171077 [Paraphaeosphaeria sporulosa]OAG12330.1 hypothetical protein CC84DRAFT_1171077 [Paraphaeosphaeria sporulosa]
MSKQVIINNSLVHIHVIRTAVNLEALFLHSGSRDASNYRLIPALSRLSTEGRLGQEQSTPALSPPPQGSAPAGPPPVLPYNPYAKACYDCNHPAGTVHVITHECLEGDALRCVIKPVRDDVPLELNDYVRAGDLLKYLEATSPPKDGLPPPPPPPASSTAGQLSGSPAVLTITATPSGGSTTITTMYTLPPHPSLLVPGSSQCFVGPPAGSSSSSSSEAPVTTITSKTTVGSTVLTIPTTIPVDSSSVVVPISSTTVPIISYTTTTVPNLFSSSPSTPSYLSHSSYTTYITTTSSCPVCAVTTKTIVSPVPAAVSSYIVVTATSLSGPPITTTIAVPAASTPKSTSTAGQSTQALDTATSATPIPPMSTVLRPPGGWPFELSSSRGNNNLRPTVSGGPPQGSVVPAPGTTSSSSAPAGLPTEFVLGGPGGIFRPPASSSRAAAGPAIATDAVTRLIAAAPRVGGRVADTQYKRSEAREPSSTAAEADWVGYDDSWDIKKGLKIRGASRHHPDSAIKLTPHIARIVLGDGQTLNPNAKLFRRLRAQKLILGPEDVELDRRAARSGQEGEPSKEQPVAVNMGDDLVGGCTERR